MATPEFKIGGYPVNWFVKPPSANFKCGICLDILKNPHQCKNGHNFCHSCISQALEIHRECPTCKTALKLSTLCVNLPLRNIIDEMLDVKCNHDNDNNDSEDTISDGCEWTGSLEQSFDHFKTCPKHLINCPLHEVQFCMNVDCTGKIKRKDLRDHIFFGGSKRNITDSMLVMAETIAYQKKEIDFFHKLCLTKEAKYRSFEDGREFFGIYEQNDDSSDFGLLKFASGSSHVGELKNRKYHGFGVHREKDGLRVGEWVNNKLQGHGMQTWPKNSAFMNTYIGDFKNNIKHGIGTMISLKETDVGCFENKIFHGKGTRTYSNDHVFNGSFSNDVPSKTVPGVLTLGKGATFAGTITNEQHFIKGKYTTSKRVVYEGIFLGKANENQVNGRGTITYIGGTEYTGEFCEGYMHGDGICSFSNGDFLEGTFESVGNNVSEITGTLTFHDDAVFEGSLKLLHVARPNKFEFIKGKFTNKDGVVYEGEFSESRFCDCMNGTGTITYLDGMVFTGEFKEDYRYGEGTCVFPNGDILKGTFDEHCSPSISGTLTMYDGATYVGTMRLQYKTHKYEFYNGKLTTNDGVVYEGEFHDNNGGTDVDGTGTITYTDGTVYTGEFRNGQRYAENASVANVVVSTDNNINTCTDDVSLDGASVGECVSESM